MENSLFSEGDKIGKYVIASIIKPGVRNSVYQAFIEGDDKKFFAIKAYPYQDPDDIDALKNEIEILDIFGDDNSIARYVDYVNYTFINQEKDEKGNLIEKNITFMCTVMDFYEYIDLMAYFSSFTSPGSRRTKPLSLEVVRKIFAKTLKILMNVHSKGIVHHDIKPHNFLVKSIDPLELAISDFEFAVQLMEDENIIHESGTIRYMAPEILNGEMHNKSVDIWSLGVMMYYFAFANYPCGINNNDKTIKDIREKVNKNHNRISYGHDRNQLAEKFRDLLKKMLVFDPANRITAEEALHHEFFDGYVELEDETKQLAEGITEVQLQIESTNNYDVHKQIEGVLPDKKEDDK